MSKTTNIDVRLDPELKEQAELVLGQLGFLLLNANKLEINEEMEKGYNEFTQGKTKSAKLVISDTRIDYNL